MQGKSLDGEVVGSGKVKVPWHRFWSFFFWFHSNYSDEKRVFVFKSFCLFHPFCVDWGAEGKNGEISRSQNPKEITVVLGVTREAVKSAKAGDIVSISVTGFMPKWTQTLVSHSKVSWHGDWPGRMESWRFRVRGVTLNGGICSTPA